MYRSTSSRVPATRSSWNRNDTLRCCAARISSFVRQVPQLALERPDRLLAGRVHELLVGLAFLALVERVLEAPTPRSALWSVVRERRMLVERVLEAGREVDLGRLDRREAVEQLVGQRRRAVLHGARQPVRPRDLAELAEDLEVELDLGHAAVGERHAAVARPGLDAHLRDPDRARRARVQLAPVAVEVRLELLDGRVLVADLADLAADADRHAVGLERPDEVRQLGRPDVVLALLFVDRSASTGRPASRSRCRCCDSRRRARAGRRARSPRSSPPGRPRTSWR